jgi:hypothetical protein
MKKLLVIILTLTSVLTVSNAQFTKVGGGLALSSGFPFHQQTWAANRSGIIAVSFKGIYELSVPLHISPSFTIFYPHITKDQLMKTTVSSMMFDVNGHYVFNSLDKFEFYGLAGLDILLAKKKEKYEGSPAFTENDNALGLNLGIGTYMKITEQFDLSGEAKYLFNNKYNQFMLNVGILLNLDWMKKHENTDM